MRLVSLTTKACLRSVGLTATITLIPIAIASFYVDGPFLWGIVTGAFSGLPLRILYNYLWLGQRAKRLASYLAQSGTTFHWSDNQQVLEIRNPENRTTTKFHFFILEFLSDCRIHEPAVSSRLQALLRT